MRPEHPEHARSALAGDPVMVFPRSGLGFSEGAGGQGAPSRRKKPCSSPTHCLQLQGQVILLLGDADVRLLQLLALGLGGGQCPSQAPQLCPQGRQLRLSLRRA